jgi:oligoribonuclease
MREEPLLWLDFETNGLNPAEIDFEPRILEAGLMVTDHLLRPGDSMTILIGPAPTDEEVSLWDPIVQEMHTRSGLLQALREKERMMALPDTDTAGWILAQWVNDRFPYGSNVMPAGASLQFDRSWGNRFFPALMRQLHYRQADVSALREWCQRWLPGCSDEEIAAAGCGKRDIHRPIPDIIDSIKLASFLHGRMDRGFGGPDLSGFDLGSPA